MSRSRYTFQPYLEKKISAQFVTLRVNLRHVNTMVTAQTGNEYRSEVSNVIHVYHTFSTTLMTSIYYRIKNQHKEKCSYKPVISDQL